MHNFVFLSPMTFPPLPSAQGHWEGCHWGKPARFTTPYNKKTPLLGPVEAKPGPGDGDAAFMQLCIFLAAFQKIMVYVSWVENTKVYVHGPIEVARAGTTTYYIRGFLKTPRSDRQDCQVHTPEKFSGHGSPRRSEIISFSYAEMTAATMGKPSADLDYLFHTNV